LCGQAEESVTISYCGDEANYALGEIGSGHKMFSAIRIPASKAAELSGNRLTEVLAVGYEIGKVANTQVFLSYDLEDEPFYMQAFTPRADEAWTTVYLNTPYQIEGKEFYIGYYCETANTSADSEVQVLPFDGKTSTNDNGDFAGEMFDNAPTEVIHASSIDPNAGNALIRAIVRGDNLLNDNVSATSLITVERARPGIPFHAYMTVKNTGVGTLTGFTAEIDCGDGEPVSVPLTCKLSTSKEKTFVLSDIKFLTAGDKTLKVTISKPNGNESANTSTVSADVKCIDNLLPRRVLLEHFTTAKCSNCPAADGILEAILDGRDDIVEIAHHAGFGTDAMTCSMATQYLWFYNSTTFAPAMMLDRVNLGDKGAESLTSPVPGPVFQFGDYDLMEQLINLRADEPAAVSVNVNAEYAQDTRELKVTVSGNTVETIDKDIYVNVFLIEDGLYGLQAGASGNAYRWDNVSRDTVTPVWGEAIELNDGAYEKTFITTLKEKWEPSNMRVIAFVSDMNRKEPNECEVYNANEAGLTLSSVQDIKAQKIHVKSVAGGISVTGDVEAADVWSVTGYSVAHLDNEGVVSLPQGVYVVRVKTPSGLQTNKVIVK